MQALIKRKEVWLYRVDFSKGNYQRQRVTLHHVNLPRRKPKGICIKQKSCKICEANTDRTERITDKYSITPGNINTSF